MRGRLRFDAGVLSGFTERSPDFGVIAGMTLVEQAISDRESTGIDRDCDLLSSPPVRRFYGTCTGR